MRNFPGRSLWAGLITAGLSVSLGMLAWLGFFEVQTTYRSRLRYIILLYGRACKFSIFFPSI